MKVLLISSRHLSLTGIGNYIYHLLQELIRQPLVEAAECFSSAQEALLD